MRSTFLYILFGLAVTSMAAPSAIDEPGVELLPKLIPKIEKRQVSVIEGLQSREIGGGFISVLPQGDSTLANGDGSSSSGRRYLRKDEVVVPESLQETSVEIAAPMENAAAKDYIAAEQRDVVRTQPGYTCYRDSLGGSRCRAPVSNNEYKSGSTGYTAVGVPKEATTPDAQGQQAADTAALALSTTTPRPAAAKSTSLTPRTASTPDNAIVVANGAVAASFGEGCLFLMVPVLFALGQGLAVA
ncbi:hypothetical protein FS837_008637 [Tulasnella sp. UAMH 9824]|nr:hypothetical protein FS837_008637 [Tulasnella sp. UAMH 9824]